MDIYYWLCWNGQGGGRYINHQNQWYYLLTYIIIMWSFWGSMLPSSSPSKWRQFGPLKHWYPTTLYHNLEDNIVNLHHCENLKIHSRIIRPNLMKELTWWSKSHWETNSHSASQEITCLLGNSEVHYFVHKSPAPDPVLSLFSPSQNLTPCFFFWFYPPVCA